MNEEQIQQSNILSTSHKFAKNSIYNVMGFIVTFPILILLTPYMLKVLGNAQFGIWAIAGVVTSYAQLSDMGMTTAIVKFVAEHWAKKEVDRISKVVSTTFFSFAVVGGLVATGLLVARNFIVINLLRVPLEMQHEAVFVVSGIVIIFYFNLVFSVYNSVLQGLQRMDVTNAIMVVSKVSRALGMWAFLAAGMGLKGLIWNGALFAILTISANLIMVKNLIPGFKLRLRNFSWVEFRSIFAYSANILVARIIALGQLPINKIILSRYVGLTFVAFYDIGERITRLVRQSFQLAISPLLPASSELHRMNRKDEIVKMYLSLSRLLYWTSVPVSILMISLAEPIVFIWLGDGYIMAARAIQFMTCGFLFSLLITPQYVILQGIGKPQINTLNHLLAATINIFLGIFLTMKIGYYGMLIAVVISYIIAYFHLDWCMRNILGIRFKEYIRNMPIIFLIFTLLTGFAIYGLMQYAYQWNLLILFSTALCAISVYSLLYLVVRNEDDKKLLNRVLSVVRNIMKPVKNMAE
ncbi:MAG: flippase [Thermoplasmatales archaeon]|nr:flippase [Thermoplasmatales archaeon]